MQGYSISQHEWCICCLGVEDVDWDCWWRQVEASCVRGCDSGGRREHGAFSASTERKDIELSHELGGRVGGFGVKTGIELWSSILRVGVIYHPNLIPTWSNSKLSHAVGPRVKRRVGPELVELLAVGKPPIVWMARCTAGCCFAQYF